LPAKLDDLCKNYGVNNSDRIKYGHGALLDAQLVAECYRKMILNDE